MALINDVIGNFGKYHYLVFILILLSKFGAGFHQMAIIFLAPPVAYSCPGNATCCSDPVYDTTIFKKTIVTEWNLICGRSYLQDMNQMLFQFGNLIGSLVFGIASDKCGRRPTLLFAVVVELFFGMASSFMNDFWSFTVMRMIVGFAVGGVMVVGFVLLMEYVGSVYRDVISSLYQVPFTLGHILLAVFGYYIRDYSYFQLAISLTTIVLLSYICLLPESPRWYLAVNRTVDATNILEKVARINGLPTETIQLQVDLYQMENLAGRKKGTCWDLFKTPNLRKNILLMSFLWLGCSYCFYGMAQYITYMMGDIFINTASSGLMSFCACMLAIPAMIYFPRKTVVIVMNLLNSVCLLIITFIPEGLSSTILGCTGVMCSFMIFVVIYPFCSEMFPTAVRNAALGVSSMMARLGSMIAPFIGELRHFGSWCAPVAFAVVPLISAVFCMLLPETKDCELPMTLEEGEAFGRRRQNQST